MNILEVMDSPRLWAAAFPARTWWKWRVFLSALFALPMTPAMFEFYREHTGRNDAPSEPFRQAALIVGRRGGKSRVLAAVGVFLATCRDHSRYLVAGEVLTVAIIASDRRQAGVIRNYALGLLRAAPALAAMIENDTNSEIVLTNGVVVEVHTGTIASPRGRTFLAVLADESAFWMNAETSRNPDVEVINSVKPGLATIPGSVLLLASSPYSKRGALWNLHRRHFGRDGARVLVWQAATLDMYVDPPEQLVADVAEAYEDDPLSARAEYGALFRDDIAAYVTQEVIDAAVVVGRHELPRQGRVSYIAFVDAAGGSGSDSMTLCVSHRENDVGVQDVLREVRPPFSPDQVCAEFAAILRSYGVLSVTADRYAGDWPTERFLTHGIRCVPSERNKSQIYVEFLPLLNAGRVELLDHPRNLAQLAALERHTGRGRDVVDHPMGASCHDDCANVTAGALVMCAGSENTSAVWRKYAHVIATRGDPLFDRLTY